MSDHDRRAVEANFSTWKEERASELAESSAFERYSSEMVLRDLDLSDEDIEGGILGGGGDGGIDSFYFFINKNLINEDSLDLKVAESAELCLIQAKYSDGYQEIAIQKIESFIRDLFDFSRDPSEFSYYNDRLRRQMQIFREHYQNIIGSAFRFKVNINYVTKTSNTPGVSILQRAENLKIAVKSIITHAQCEFLFIGAAELVKIIRSTPNKTIVLRYKHSLMDNDGSVICVCYLREFAKFITDDSGSLRQHILDPNVRDYQGNNKVNKGIRKSLKETEVREFWWLNNGITVLCDSVVQSAGTLAITAPEIVNGLQTSHEIFNFFGSLKDDDDRSILVRVIKVPDEIIRDRITFATNSQTPVSGLSLHATEYIHYEIEELLKLYKIYYDRKKGKYKRLKMPLSKIVSMKALSQAMLSFLRWKPHSARGRPDQALEQDDNYEKIFDPKIDRNIFVAGVILDRGVAAYLSERSDIGATAAFDLRYYILSCLGSVLVGKLDPSSTELAGIAAKAVKDEYSKFLESVTNLVYDVYQKQGGNDKAAKSSEMTKEIRTRLLDLYPSLKTEKP